MMNGRHLPPDIGRRRHYNPHPSPYQPGPPMYNGTWNPYSQGYYPQMQPQYPNAVMPGSSYVPYLPYAHGRSPPPQMHPYAQAPPPAPSYPRHQPSPVASTIYQPPPPQTSSSTQSSHTIPGPLTPPTPQTSQIETVVPEEATPKRPPFRAPLPWLSHPDQPWPIKRARSRRRRRAQIDGDLELPNAEADPSADPTPVPSVTGTPAESADVPPIAENALEEAPPAPLEPSEPTKPSEPPNTASDDVKEETANIEKPVTRPAPIVPIIPALPKVPSRESPKATTQASKVPEDGEPKESAVVDAEVTPSEPQPTTQPTDTEEPGVPAQVAPPRPSLWTGLFKAAAPGPVTGNTTPSSQNGVENVGGVSKSRAESMAETLRAFNTAATNAKVSFLKPRGLVNTGNMCYMNSVLQVLLFCIPFYDFLDQVGKRAVHSFKGDTPLIDAMIMFMREFPIIDSAVSVEQLRMRLKDNEFEQFGEQFTPDFVYDVIRRLPRFANMKRGHQQDAEEFLGFLLEGLHDECVHVMRANGGSNASSTLATPANGSASPMSEVESAFGESGDGWHEVGPKQKPAITRSSGTITTSSPITKIFGGTLRSELRVPGLKNSVTLEPYQPLQLDIGSPQVHNIVDALKGLTRPEALQGDFKSPKGPKVSATKQVFIETLPPVLILHLKRFQYDSNGGVQKIWKKIGYPLELELPKEVFSRQQQGKFLGHGGLPKYRLIAVVYHHGKNASGGHYTVDVRRQDGREWIRLDDTVINRVGRDDVAEGGSEEDPKVIAAAMEAHKKDSVPYGNIFDQIKNEEDGESDGGEGWKEVNGSATGNTSGAGKKWASVANGASGPKTKTGNTSIKDNKVAYLLFYQRMGN